MNTENTPASGTGPQHPDHALRDAGRRLRATAPDEVATRQALRNVHDVSSSIPATVRAGRAWAPFAWAAGLTAAAVIGIVALAARSPEDTIREIPADTTPPTQPAVAPTTDPLVVTPSTVVDDAPATSVPPPTDPVVAPPSSATPRAAGSNDRTVTYEFRSDHCFAMSLDAPDRRIGRAAGCVPQDELSGDGLYLTMMEGELYRIDDVPGEVDGDGRPLLTIKTFPDWSTASCGLIDAFPPEPGPGSEASALVIELIACSGGEEPAALASRIPQEEGRAPEAFTTGAPHVPGGAELSGPVEVSGLIGVDAYYGDVLPGVRCVAVTQVFAGSEWREQCWDVGDDPTGPLPAVTMINGFIVQLDLADERAPTAAIPDSRGLPFTGCGRDDIESMASAVLSDAQPGLLFTHLRCDDLSGVMGAASTLLQPGRADGGFDQFIRTDRAQPWTYVNSGTAIDPPFPYAVIPHELWAPWPGDTTAYASDRRDVTFGGSSGVAASNIEAVTGAVEDGGDPEFPPNPTILGVWPTTGIPSLVVVQVDLGGDDSVAGAVHYVHVSGGPNEYRVADWFTSWICARGGGPDLCV